MFDLLRKSIMLEWVSVRVYLEGFINQTVSWLKRTAIDSPYLCRTNWLFRVQRALFKGMAQLDREALFRQIPTCHQFRVLCSRRCANGIFSVDKAVNWDFTCTFVESFLPSFDRTGLDRRLGEGNVYTKQTIVWNKRGSSKCWETLSTKVGIWIF